MPEPRDPVTRDEDAGPGVDEDGGSDDGNVLSDGAPDAGTPPWWAPLQSHPNYVVRARFFGRDRTLGDGVFLAHEVIFWAKLTIDREQGRVAMELQRCRDQGTATSTIALRDDYVFVHPERLAPEQHELVLRDGFVQSVAPPRTLGYQAAPTECTPNARVVGSPDQPWLNGGTCRCGPEPLPVLANDCRIVDADGDGEPGFSVRHTGFRESTDFVRAKDACQIVQGTLGADGRIRGSYMENYDYLAISCGANACVHNEIVVCPLEQNPVLFEPLPDLAPSGEAWDCATVNDAAETRLPSEMLIFPAEC